MKKINQEATKTFCQLMDKMGIEEYRQFTSGGFMPLTMEQITGAECISTPYGAGQRYSLYHHYLQNGDVMRDPEMVFIVIDHRKDVKEYALAAVYPQLYRQDGLGIYEESITIENNRLTTYKPARQAAHCSFANQWLKNIKWQGFIP